MNYERQLKQTLRRLGITKPSKGYYAVILAVKLAMEEPLRLSYIFKEIYVDAAHSQRTSPFCIERNIRTLIEQIWQKGDHEYLDEVFKKPLEKKPTNTEFIAALANYLGEQPRD